VIEDRGVLFRFLSLIAGFYLWIWWHIRVDPTGYLRPVGSLLGTIIVGVGTVVAAITLISNVLLGDRVLASTNEDGTTDTTGLFVNMQSALARVGDSSGGNRKSDTNEGQSVETNEVAASGVPKNLFSVYNEAAARCDMDWEVLAAVGWVESHHGELVAPGVKDGANFAGAQGPMQFLGATWNAYGVDGDGDGKADVYNPVDSVHGAAEYLCSNGANEESKLRDALWNYNHSWDYVDEVLAVADSYRSDVYALPLERSTIEGLDVNAAHHNYPAVDFPVPVGSPVFAVHGGQAKLTDGGRCGAGVSIEGEDGVEYLYCHLDARSISNGTQISAGEQIGTSGGQPGAAGAGSSTGPHLHLQVTHNGQLVCPQSLLRSWADGDFVHPSEAPTSGCTN
jgi:hypothetical protein